MKKLALMDVLDGIKDTRRARSVIYPLKEVLFIVMVAVICGATSYSMVEIFGNSNEEWLKKYLKLEYGIPDACTFRNIIKQIATDQLHTAFVDWMKSVVEAVKGVVAIDGKQARRTKEEEKKPLHVVSAFASEYRLVLGQLACEEKSNEITAIPKLLDMLEIKGCIVTIDAMGTQTGIAKKIRKKEADYILALKANQGKLYDEVKAHMDEQMKDADTELKEKGKIENPFYAMVSNRGHGRIESRECFICEDIEWMENRNRWIDLNGIGVIRSTVEKKGRISVQYHYFIYSCKGMSAAQIMRYKRDHWAIENGLHWILDMEFREDESRARKDNSAENLNVLRHIVYNALRNENTFRGSIRDKQFRCSLDKAYLEKVIDMLYS